MPDYVDALAGRLAELQRDGSLPWSQLGAAARQALQGLLDSGALARIRSGRGERVTLVRPDVLEHFIRRRYPHGLISIDAGGRAEAVRQLRSAKRGGRGSRLSAVLVRVLREGALTVDGLRDELHRLTVHAGAAAVVLGRGDATCSGTVVTVENEDVFHRIEEILPDADVAIYTAGRMSDRLVDWLSHQAGVEQIVHAGDYDPVGVAEYLRLRARLGDRVRLHIPPDLEALFERYSNPAILRREGNQRAMVVVRESDDPTAQQVGALIQRYGAGLEQEILLDKRSAD